MIRFVTKLLAVIALVVGFNIVAVPAQAVPVTQVTQSVDVVKASPSVSIPLVAPQSPSVPMPKVIGNGGIKPFYQWLPPQYCYWSGITIRSYYCYRYSCTYFEKLAWGCYDGYVRISTSYWA